MADWTIESVGEGNAKLTFTLENTVDEARILLRSDAHQDHPSCRQDVEMRHLRQARHLGAAIIDNGDCFCAMQGAHDKRATKGKTRPEHDDQSYADYMVDDAVERYKLFAPNFAMFGWGNHETAFRRHNNTDLTGRLVKNLRALGSPAIHGYYSGFVHVNLKRGTECRSLKIWRHHGSGGGAKVTKGVIDHERSSAWVDADIIWLGHTHTSYCHRVMRVATTERGKVVVKPQYHVRTPGYKSEWGYGKGGYIVEKDCRPQPVGAYWLRIRVANTGLMYKLEEATEGIWGLDSVWGTEETPDPVWED